MKLVLNNKKYTFLIGYRKDNSCRAAFNHLAKTVFNISFEEWYQAGYWNDKYIPYTLFEGENAVANISVNIMDFQVFGERKRYIQLGTVMTDENYRHQNLNRFLMEHILKEWNSKCDLIYLYANSTVLEFYPKFGFSQVNEFCFSKPLHTTNGEDIDIKKLDMDQKQNRERLHDYAKNTKAFGKICLIDNADLIMFYGISPFKDNVYYIQSLDAVVIAAFENKQLHLIGVFGKKVVNLDEVISALANFAVEEVRLGFVPDDYSSYEARAIAGDDFLFVQNGRAKFFEDNELMFPVLSHA